MRPTLSIPLALAACLFTTGLASAQERPRFEIEAGYWEPDVSGGLRVVEGEVGGDVDLAGDLGLQADAVTELRLVFHPSRRTEIRFTRLPLSFSADAVVSRTIEFGGEVFTLSTRVVSALEMDYLRAGFAWQFLSSADGRFRAGPLLEVKGYDGRASLSAPDLILPVTVSEGFEAAFGSAGIAIDLEPSSRVHVFGELSTIVGAGDGTQTDFEVGVAVAVAGPLALRAGYRSIRTDFEDAGDRVDLDVDGIFFGAGLRF